MDASGSNRAGSTASRETSEAEQKLVYNTGGAGAGPVHAKVEGTAWRTKPSWYIVASQDRTVHPELERFVASEAHGGNHRRGGQQPCSHALQPKSLCWT
jgi:hypothetical protein